MLMCAAATFVLVLGVTTEGRDAMRGILVGVADGGTRPVASTPLLRNEDADEALCSVCCPATGNFDARSRLPIAVGVAVPLPLTGPPSAVCGWW